MSKLDSSDIRHNRNCYAYLRQLAPYVTDTVLKSFSELNLLRELGEYDESFAYGDLYSSTITYLEQCIGTQYTTLSPEQAKEVNRLILAIYDNDNGILEDTVWFKEVSPHIRPQNNNAEHVIAHHLEDSLPLKNKQSPKKAGSLFSRFYALFSSNFKPQSDTNIPSQRNSKERRIPTQGQFHNGESRVNPLFELWLTVRAKELATQKEIDHIYFNNLGKDRGIFNIPGSKEKELTNALHELEKNPSLKIAVITLPASQGIMGSDHYKHTNDQLTYNDVFNEFLDVALNEKHSSGIVDFKISTQVRTLLFGSSENAEELLRQLIRSSFETMGIKAADRLSTAQKQAVWLHFIKFELTNYIINTLQPSSYNFSCKDAIDRGAVSSTYYRLHKSFSLEKPMSKEEFERDLHIAAANVKGRGMNFHRKIIWNALDAFVNANYNALLQDKRKSWLIYWRDMNCPHTRVKQLIGQRLTHYESLLDSLPPHQEKMKIEGRKLCAAIKEQYEHQVNGQRLLLEAVSRSIQLLLEPPTPESIKAYRNLAHELQIKHPALQFVAGIMLVFLGAVLFSPSLIKQGVAKIKTGFFATERKNLCLSIMNNVPNENQDSPEKLIDSEEVSSLLPKCLLVSPTYKEDSMHKIVF